MEGGRDDEFGFYCDLTSSMERTSLLHRERNAVSGVTGLNRNRSRRRSNSVVPGIPKGEGNPKALSLTGSMARGTKLADITNLVINERTSRSRVGGDDDRENSKATPLDSSKDYIAQLLKENAALMMLLGERNKSLELNGMEIQKLRFALQKYNQQNHLLALANTQMLAEHNQDKNRLKALQHELGCTVAVLRAKALELEEKNRLIKQQGVMICSEQIMEGHAKLDNVTGDDALVNANRKNVCNPNRKRTLRNRSLGSATMLRQVTTKKKDENRRRSLRRSSSLNNEPTRDLFKIEDVSFPIRLVPSDSMHEDSSGQADSSAPSVSDAITSTVKEQDMNRSLQNQSQGTQIKISTGSLASDPMHEDSSGHLDSLDPLVPDAIPNLVKEEQKEWERTSLNQNQNQGVRRSSTGRPLRRAAENVCSYKEAHLNTKF